MVYIMLINSEEDVTVELFDSEAKRETALKNYLECCEVETIEELEKVETYVYLMEETVK